MKKTELLALLHKVVCEGVMDNLTTQLSRLIVNHIKKHANVVVADFVADVGTLKVFVVFEETAVDVPKIGGAEYNRISEVLKILILLPETGFFVRSLNSFIPKLKNVLRHELEHRQQGIRAGKDWEVSGVHKIPRGMSTQHFRKTNPSPQDAKNYFLSPKEIEAFVMGAYKTAKTTRTPLQTVLASQLEDIQTNLSLKFGEKEAEKITAVIKTAWIEYAKIRIPNFK